MFFGKVLMKFGLVFLLHSWALGSNSDVNEYYELRRDISQLERERGELLNRIQIAHLSIKTPWNRPFIAGFVQRIDAIEEVLSLRVQALNDFKEKDVFVEAFVGAPPYRGDHRKDLVKFRETLGFILSPEDETRIFFTDDKTFELWNRNNHQGDSDQKVHYYANKSDYIRNCLNIVDDKKKNVLYPKVSPCRDGHGHIHSFGGRLVRYTLKKLNEQIRLGIDLNFHFRDAQERERDAFSKLREAEGCMSDFFARHGIVLDLGIYNSEKTHFEERPFAWAVQSLSNLFQFDYGINLHISRARANSNNWPYLRSGSRTLTKETRCTLYIHELLHSFGLDDTYPGNCLNRTPRPVNDIMAAGASTPLRGVHIYDEDVQQILDPLCGV